jgi:hypothetical protein
MERKRFRIASEKESFSAVCFCAHTPAGPCWGHTSSFPAVLCGSRLSTSHLDHASHTPVLTLPPQRLYANGSVDDSPRGACGALLPVQQTGGCRMVRQCDPFWRGRGVQGVRQTLSHGAGHNGTIARRLPDREGVRGFRWRPPRPRFCSPPQRAIWKSPVMDDATQGICSPLVVCWTPARTALRATSISRPGMASSRKSWLVNGELRPAPSLAVFPGLVA